MEAVYVDTDGRTPLEKPVEERLRFENRFIEKVDIPTGEDGEPDREACWEWTAGTDRYGYGQFFVGSLTPPNGDTDIAHRVAYRLWHNVVHIEGECLMHECDNRRCCNPHHLQAGSQQENIDQASEQGHMSVKGVDRKDGFSEDEIREIRRLNDDPDWVQAEIAEEFDVSTTAISKIVRRESYAYVE
ncbi:hypothetical protein [Natrialbaceae archaeon AArc-T1-2]|uniref:hypothetical protein n=1 Tax=Natrialbaceae archaeon AArc-T1-2 TaxID=3053904 RepID=UPI00255AC321|nr:hypothetical protein [Natrialbaceae archaeon AArc-T1-2]WIV66567.1 hypothetical protein QQ977_12820 [Natrialbaceae archaeon AArc-T1-2]